MSRSRVIVTNIQCHTQVPMFPSWLCIGSGADISSQEDINSSTDAFTHIRPMSVTTTNQWMGSSTVPIQDQPCSLIGASTSDWWLEQHTSGVWWACIHVLMHAHILNKVGEQKWGNWDTRHTDIQRHPDFHQTMHREWSYHMGSQVDINSCTDACTRSKQSVWP